MESEEHSFTYDDSLPRLAYKAHQIGFTLETKVALDITLNRVATFLYKPLPQRVPLSSLLNANESYFIFDDFRLDLQLDEKEFTKIEGIISSAGLSRAFPKKIYSHNKDILLEFYTSPIRKISKGELTKTRQIFKFTAVENPFHSRVELQNQNRQEVRSMVEFDVGHESERQPNSLLTEDKENFVCSTSQNDNSTDSGLEGVFLRFLNSEDHESLNLSRSISQLLENSKSISNISGKSGLSLSRKSTHILLEKIEKVTQSNDNVKKQNEALQEQMNSLQREKKEMEDTFTLKLQDMMAKINELENERNPSSFADTSQKMIIEDVKINSVIQESKYTDTDCLIEMLDKNIVTDSLIQETQITDTQFLLEQKDQNVGTEDLIPQSKAADTDIISNSSERAGSDDNKILKTRYTQSTQKFERTNKHPDICHLDIKAGRNNRETLHEIQSKVSKQQPQPEEKEMKTPFIYKDKRKITEAKDHFQDANNDNKKTEKSKKLSSSLVKVHVFAENIPFYEKRTTEEAFSDTLSLNSNNKRQFCKVQPLIERCALTKNNSKNLQNIEVSSLHSQETGDQILQTKLKKVKFSPAQEIDNEKKFASSNNDTPCSKLQNRKSSNISSQLSTDGLANLSKRPWHQFIEERCASSFTYNQIKAQTQKSVIYTDFDVVDNFIRQLRIPPDIYVYSSVHAFNILGKKTLKSKYDLEFIDKRHIIFPIFSASQQRWSVLIVQNMTKGQDNEIWWISPSKLYIYLLISGGTWDAEPITTKVLSYVKESLMRKKHQKVALDIEQKAQVESILGTFIDEKQEDSMFTMLYHLNLFINKKSQESFTSSFTKSVLDRGKRKAQIDRFTQEVLIPAVKKAIP
jgi:hypothetical protein